MILTEALRDIGFTTMETNRHLGLELGMDMKITIKETLKIDLKTVKRRILATTPPTDMLYRATLIKSAMTPLYNHVLMALPAIEEDLQPLYKETLSCLWTKTENSETIQKSCFVAKKRLSTSFGMGGLQNSTSGRNF